MIEANANRLHMFEAIVLESAKDDVNQAKWLLQKLYPQIYSEKAQLEITQKQEPQLVSVSEQQVKAFIEQLKHQEIESQAKEVKYSEKDGETDES